MSNETVTARLARIIGIVDDAIDEMTLEKTNDLSEMKAALGEALASLKLAYETAEAGLIETADGIIDSRYFTDFDDLKRYVYKLGARDGHPIMLLTHETDESEPDPGAAKITGVTVGTSVDSRVTLTATGENLSQDAGYGWLLILDDVSFIRTSEGKTLTFDPVLDALYTEAVAASVIVSGCGSRSEPILLKSAE